MSFPDFSLISFVEPGKQAKSAISGERIDLYKFFDAIVNKHSLEIDQYQLDEIFVQDLAIDTKKYDKILVGVLAEALIYFMTLWPGWEKSNDYYTGKIHCREWFEKFKNYLIVKSTNIINNAAKYSKKDKSKNRIAEVQADISERNGGKRVAPYILCVGGPPNVLNNVVFVETAGSIFVKQHAEKQWPHIKINELLNWPYVTIEVELPDISIKRANTHVMQRFLALADDSTVYPELDTIRHVEKLPNSAHKELQPYSYDFFSSYFSELKETFKLVPGVNRERLHQLEAIFVEFLADIKEANYCNMTMCPYFSVAFHIGKSKYIRNKKVSAGPGRKPNEGINFYEMIVPEIDFSLNYFKVVQDVTDSENVTFESLNKLKKIIKESSTDCEIETVRDLINNTSIKFYCTLCEENFCGPEAFYNLNEHFRSIHKCEQPLFCQKCRNQFEVQYLTSNRWYHKCAS